MQFKQLPNLKLQPQCNIIHTQTIHVERSKSSAAGCNGKLAVICQVLRDRSFDPCKSERPA